MVAVSSVNRPKGRLKPATLRSLPSCTRLVICLVIPEIAMNTWPVQDAKARFSELIDACINEGPQLVTRRGAETAVLIPIAEWKRLSNAARPSLKTLLLSDCGRADLDLPARGFARRRS